MKASSLQQIVPKLLNWITKTEQKLGGKGTLKMTALVVKNIFDK